MGVTLVPRGSRYHTGIPNVRLGSWIVVMTGVTMMLDGGNKNGTLTICPTMGGNGKYPVGGVMGEEVGYCS